MGRKITYTWPGAPTAAGWICRRSGPRCLSSRYGICGCGDGVEIKNAGGRTLSDVDAGDTGSDARTYGTKMIEKAMMCIVRKSRIKDLMLGFHLVQSLQRWKKLWLRREQRKNESLVCNQERVKNTSACCEGCWKFYDKWWKPVPLETYWRWTRFGGGCRSCQ